MTEQEKTHLTGNVSEGRSGAEDCRERPMKRASAREGKHERATMARIASPQRRPDPMAGKPSEHL